MNESPLCSTGLQSVRADVRPDRTDFRPEVADFKPERADLRPEKADFRPKRADFRSERVWGGRTNGWMGKQTNKSPPVFYRTSSPSGPPPKKDRLSIWAGAVKRKTP